MYQKFGYEYQLFSSLNFPRAAIYDVMVATIVNN